MRFERTARRRARTGTCTDGPVARRRPAALRGDRDSPPRHGPSVTRSGTRAAVPCCVHVVPSYRKTRRQPRRQRAVERQPLAAQRRRASGAGGIAPPARGGGHRVPIGRRPDPDRPGARAVRRAPELAGRERAVLARDESGQRPHPIDVPRQPEHGQQRLLRAAASPSRAPRARRAQSPRRVQQRRAAAACSLDRPIRDSRDCRAAARPVALCRPSAHSRAPVIVIRCSTTAEP